MNQIYIKKIETIDTSLYPDFLFKRSINYVDQMKQQSINAYAMLYQVFKENFNYLLKEEDLVFNKCLMGHYYSISHSKDFVMVTISNDVVGCDIESMINILKKEKSIKKIFNEEAIDMLAYKWCYFEALFKTKQVSIRKTKLDNEIVLKSAKKIIINNELYVIAVASAKNLSIDSFDMIF